MGDNALGPEVNESYSVVEGVKQEIH